MNPHQKNKVDVSVSITSTILHSRDALLSMGDHRSHLRSSLAGCDGVSDGSEVAVTHHPTMDHFEDV